MTTTSICQVPRWPQATLQDFDISGDGLELRANGSCTRRSRPARLTLSVLRTHWPRCRSFGGSPEVFQLHILITGNIIANQIILLVENKLVHFPMAAMQLALPQAGLASRVVQKFLSRGRRAWKIAGSCTLLSPTAQIELQLPKDAARIPTGCRCRPKPQEPWPSAWNAET